jgi:hypothetical protein
MGPEKRPSGLVSIDAAGAAVKPLPMPPHRCRWTDTPGTRRLKATFDGDWLSPRSKNRTRRMAASVQLWLAQNLNRRVQAHCRHAGGLEFSLALPLVRCSQSRVLGSSENFYRSLMIELDLKLPRDFRM